MLKQLTHRSSLGLQFIACIGIVVIASVCCFFVFGIIGYKIVALVLLMFVSLLAMLFDILPVLSAAVLSALIWDFFFIPPVFNFHIDNTEDLLMFLLYFFIALVNAVLTVKIRQAEKKARDKEEKDKAIQLYNTLLNSLSHELRTPISTIIGAVDTLKDNKNRLNEKNQFDLLTEIETASIRLNRQVENLLNISRLESGMIQPKLDWCDVNELIYTIIQKLDVVSKNHTIIFTENERLPYFKVDGGLLGEIIYNIVHNALQYTPQQSEIRIQAIQRDNELNIVISDTGNGLPQNELQNIFNKFYRLPKTRTGGTGLGLSISKGFVEAHRGTITAENNTLNGAKFTISLPAETSFLKFLKNE